MIETDRLILRQWKIEDRDPFFDLNSNEKVMEFFPNTLTREQSDSLAGKINQLMQANGWGLFAVELKESGEFIGFIGLASPTFKTKFTPCVEIGWRLNEPYWKKGYATEGALAVLNFAFKELSLDEVVSFTSIYNTPSISVMEKIGMKKDLDGNFMHPNIEEGHRLCEHVLYRVQKRDMS